MEKVTVCVDVMGGDEKPEVVLGGIAEALKADPDLTVLACGPAEIVDPFCAQHAGRAEALHAPDVITMEDDPIKAVMRKRKSSIVVGCRAVRKGNAQGFFSAGSTGACTAAAAAFVQPFKYRDGSEVRSVRPCLTSALPNMAGGVTELADMGANPDVDPRDMMHFALMASAYARIVCGIENPRVGLLSNGTEDEKGSKLTKACFPLFEEKVPGFVGNREGTDLLSGSTDVMVADGFAGNVALKSVEITVKFLLKELKGALYSSPRAKVGALLAKPALSSIKDKISGDAIGGAMLVGLKGVVLIGHGATSVEAVKNGTLATARAVRGKLVETIADSIDGLVA